MSGVVVGQISVVAILVLIYAGMYVPVALGLVSFVAVWFLRNGLDAPLYLVTLAASNTLEDYVLGVVPLLVLMGLLVSHSRMGRDLYRAAHYLLGGVRGGLGVATVAANAACTAITGVNSASASVFARVAVPEMVRCGYQPRFAVGVVAGSSVLGMLLPPGVMLIIYAMITGQSVVALFRAAIIPGMMLALAYFVAIVVMATFFPHYVGGQITQHAAGAGASELTRSELTGKTAPLVTLILLVLGGIYGGILTPTEAGAVGALGALIISMLQRRLDRKVLWQVLVETGHIVASVLMLVVAATMYSRMLGISGLPNELGQWINQADLGLYGTLTIYVLLLIVLGMILDRTSIILVMVPLFLPVVMPHGADLVWFGIVTIAGAEIGLLTSPLGMSCCVIKSALADERISRYDIFAGALPFTVIMLLVLMLLIAFPSLSLTLV